MENTVEIYQEEKELREKRLAAYAESIQEKVQKDSEQIIKILVEERCRQMPRCCEYKMVYCQENINEL